MIEQITNLCTAFQTESANIPSSDALEALRIKYLGRKGLISALFDGIKDVPAAERREYGKALNELKNLATTRLDELQRTFTSARPAQTIDPTLPGRKDITGGLHPLTIMLNEITDIFRRMGFTVETGPEAETVHYNFDALNTPIWHPARDATDTFYLDIPGGQWLLRTETSPVQIRVMERQPPPIRIIAPGRVYRNDKPDATHSPVFMQVEGLYVDKGVTFADLKGTVLAFYRALFGDGVSVRFRPHFFPFTEPSAEVDMSCIFCSGKGCRICKQTGWLEMGGSGMVDPNVFLGVGIDPEVYTGWAFGLGIERIASRKWGVDDIRLFYENDLRFLEQFK
jgi:phenylalanyl-tRNA synthetase alpha chain